MPTGNLNPLVPFPFRNCKDSKPTKDEDLLVPLCTLAALPTFIRSRKRPANVMARPRDPMSPQSAKAAAEAVEAEARVCEMAEAHTTRGFLSRLVGLFAVVFGREM